MAQVLQTLERQHPKRFHNQNHWNIFYQETYIFKGFHGVFFFSSGLLSIQNDRPATAAVRWRA